MPHLYLLYEFVGGHYGLRTAELASSLLVA